MTKIKEFPWDEYKHLGHNFTRIYNSTTNNGWHECSNCNVKVYTDTASAFALRLMCWEDDLFHNLSFKKNSDGVVEFNLTCKDVIIKKIIE